MRPSLASCVLSSLAVAAACSDDGFPNQSSGQAPTSTSGSSEGSGAEPTTGPTGAGTSTGSGSGSGTTESTGETPADSSTGSSDTTSAGTSSSGETTEGTGGGPSVACAAGCAVEFACGMEWATEEDCVAWCEANLIEAAAFSPYCRDAWEGVSACVGTLTCEEFGEWQNPTMFPYPCSDADVVLQVECEGQ